jgi:hypothetical protein
VEHDRLLVLELAHQVREHGVEGAGGDVLRALDVAANVIWARLVHAQFEECDGAREKVVILPSSRTSIMAMVESPAAAASWAVRRAWEREDAERRGRSAIVAILGSCWGSCVGGVDGQDIPESSSVIVQTAGLSLEVVDAESLRDRQHCGGVCAINAP